MAHAQKPDFVFRPNARVHFNRWGCQFSRLLAAEVYASAVVMLDTPCSEVVWRVLATHSIRRCPLQFPSRASPCAITFQLESTSVYSSVSKLRNRFLLSFGLLVVVWNKIESCARPLPPKSSVSVLGCQKREWEREWVFGESEGEVGKEGEKVLSLQGNWVKILWLWNFAGSALFCW